MSYDTMDDLREVFRLLEQAGWNPRLCDTPVPHYETAVPCGPALEIGEVPPETKMVPTQFLAAHPMFMVDVRGDSMKDVGITDGDIVTVVAGTKVEDGDIVLVMIDGETTVKSFFRDEDGETWLVPQNADYEPILLSSRQNVWVIGVVRDVMRPTPRISYRTCRNIVAKAKAGQVPPRAIQPEQVSKAIREIASMITAARQWYAVFRVLVDAGVFSSTDFDAFCGLLRETVPDHPRLPVSDELQRMAVQSFAKPVARWTPHDAPVQGKRYNDYLSIAKRMKELLALDG